MSLDWYRHLLLILRASEESDAVCRCPSCDERHLDAWEVLSEGRLVYECARCGATW